MSFYSHTYNVKGATKGSEACSSIFGISRSCVQTLEMGLAVRNAICIGMEVWTVDWAGNVTVRERDDATKVRCEIPTNRC